MSFYFFRWTETRITESFWLKIVPMDDWFVRKTQSGGSLLERHTIVNDYCSWFCLPESQSLILCSAQFLPNKRHLDHVSDGCDSAFSWELWSRHWVLLHLDFPRKGWGVWRRWSVVPPCCVFLLQGVRSPGWIGCWRNNSCETQTLSDRKELKRAPSIQVQFSFHHSVLELLENKSNNFGILAYSNLVLLFPSWMYRSLSVSEKYLVLLCSRTLSAISALSCPNEMLHQIVGLLDHNDAPTLWPFWRSLLQEILLCVMNKQE